MKQPLVPFLFRRIQRQGSWVREVRMRMIRFQNLKLLKRYFNRALTISEITKLETYLKNKWLGGSLENFPILVRLASNSPAGFDRQLFADPSTGGDLRFYDQNHDELPFVIDEWNASGESLVWVKVPSLESDTRVFAYWGNEDNTTLPTYDFWYRISGFWHLDDYQMIQAEAMIPPFRVPLRLVILVLSGKALIFQIQDIYLQPVTRVCLAIRLGQLVCGCSPLILVVRYLPGEIT